MAVYFISLCLITLVLVVSLIYVQDQVTRNYFTKDKPFIQPSGSDRIAHILNRLSPRNSCKGVKTERNFTAPGLRISEIKCLEYTWDVMTYEHRVRWKHKCNGRVVGGGRAAQYGEFPHMGALGWRSLEEGKDKWVYKCGASLISDKFLVTAAHCSRLPTHDRSVYVHVPEVVKLGDKFIINNFPLIYDGMDDYLSSNKTFWDTESLKNISGGEVNISSKIKKINRIIKHPDYESPRHYYDIALVELQESVVFGTLIRPACLWNNHDTSVFGNVTVSGWGQVNPVTRLMSEELQVGEVGIIDDKFCDSLLKTKHNRNWNGLSNHQLCAGVLSGRVDTCRGDSGGPLQAKVNISLRWPVYHLIGVTSFSYGCMHRNVPGIYVRVASFVDWIESIVWPET